MFPWYWTYVRLLCFLGIPIHIRWRPWQYVYFTIRDILFYRRFKPIHSYKQTSPCGLKPSIYSRAAHLWTECTQPGDWFSHSPFHEMYVRADVKFFVRNTYAFPTCRCSNNSYKQNVPYKTGSFTRFRFFIPYGQDITSFWKVRLSCKQDTEWHNEWFHRSTSMKAGKWRKWESYFRAFPWFVAWSGHELDGSALYQCRWVGVVWARRCHDCMMDCLLGLLFFIDPSFLVNSHLGHSRVWSSACSPAGALLHPCVPSNLSTTTQEAIVKLRRTSSEICTLFIWSV